MCQIIILTYNPQADKTLQRNLELLGFEVLCSKNILEDTLYDKEKNILYSFPIIFFSCTIPDTLINILLQKEVIQSRITFRVDTEIPPEKKMVSWQEKGLINFISNDSSLRALRELIDNNCAVNNTIVVHQYLFRDKYKDIKDAPKNISTLLEGFSKREQKLFSILLGKQGVFITRVELASLIWKEGPTQSHLAQLSQLVTRMRAKLDRKGCPLNSLETNWKKGYRISNEMLNLYSSLEC